MSYEPGARIGKYEVRRKLGKGAMGEVYVAWDTVLERHAALKVMATSSMEESDLRTRFEREAKAVARLQHPNIITVYDFGYDEWQAAYIVMELLKGSDLEQSLINDPPSVSQSLRIVLQVCRGLAHAHDNDIVHRDVKPANIFVTEDGLVKIMDFGIARWTQAAQTKTGTVIGTAAFMSPEQLLGQRVDGRSDIFSLGIILYQLLSHQQPFSGENVGQIFYRILNAQAPRLLLEGEHIPGLQRILDRALAKDLDERYRSAHEMAHELAELIPDLGETLIGQATVSLGPPVVAPVKAAAPPRPDPGTPAVESGSPAVREKDRSYVRPGALALAAVAVVLFAGLYFFSGGGRGLEPHPGQESPVESPGPAVTGGSQGRGDGAEVAATMVEAAGSAPGQAIGEPEPEPEQPVEPRPDGRGTPPESEAPTVVAPPPPPTAAERAAGEADAARAALERGEIEEASRAISRGQQLAPSQPVWRDLDDRLKTLRTERDQRRLTEERAGRFLDEALGHLEADELDQAIAAFRKALVFDPKNTQASNGLRQVETLKRKQELRQQSEPRRGFSESSTELVQDARPPGLEGFSTDDEVDVEKGSADLSVPGELLIELNPRDAKPAEPYTLTVRLHNETNTGLLVKSLELVTSYGGRKLGEGVEIPMNLRRIGARSTVLLHEASGQWKEEQNAGGSITATVTLVKGKLKKILTWSASS